MAMSFLQRTLYHGGAGPQQPRPRRRARGAAFTFQRRSPAALLRALLLVVLSGG